MNFHNGSGHRLFPRISFADVGMCVVAGTQEYSTPIDMWSLGCIMAELLTKKVLFDGQSEIEQIKKIFEVLGTPTEENWPGHKKLKNMDKVRLVSCCLWPPIILQSHCSLSSSLWLSSHESLPASRVFLLLDTLVP